MNKKSNLFNNFNEKFGSVLLIQVDIFSAGIDEAAF